MPKSKGFTQVDQRFISSQCNSIARLEKNGIKDRDELRKLSIPTSRFFDLEILESIKNFSKE